MTPKDKSKELIDKFYKSQVEVLNINGTTELESVEHEIAIKSSLIAVDEILDILTFDLGHDQTARKLEEHWQQVKTELENL